MHRDLKPENLLITGDNILKLCDFGSGSCYEIQRNTFCGTYEYMAPEMVKNVPHDERVDVWALGVLLYELVHNQEPFAVSKGNTDAILQGEIHFRNDLSE